MIKNLLFDLGGVITDLQRQRCVDEFILLGLPDAPSYFGEYSQSGIFMDLESGKISVDEFHRELHKAFPPGVNSPDSELDRAFELFIAGIPVHRLRALLELRKKYKIYLLSNTNPIMWDDILAREFEKIPPYVREDYFDGMVTSFEAHAAKPDPAIFIYTKDTLGIVPEETLFFDDSLANVHAARALGFHARLIEPETEFMDALRDFENGL